MTCPQALTGDFPSLTERTSETGEGHKPLSGCSRKLAAASCRTYPGPACVILRHWSDKRRMSVPDRSCRPACGLRTAGMSQISPCQYRERLEPSNPIQNMNEWQELESGDGGLNGRVWVLRKRGCIACHARLQPTRLATLVGTEARSSVCPSISSDVTTGAPQKSKMP